MFCRKNIFGLLAFMLALSLAQCAKKYDYAPTDNSAIIDSIRPQRGTENTQVRIYGRNFPVDTSKLKAFFNSKQGLVIEKSTNNVILASVPSEAGTGNVSLKIGDKNIVGPVFTYDYDAPVITDVSPLLGNAGTEITINGRKFSSSAANNKVTVNGLPATVISSSATQIKATVPETKNGPVAVTSNGITNSGPVFRFIPQFTGLDKTSGFAGEVIVLNGKYFDAGPNVAVSFNGVAGTIISNAGTSIEVRVPASTSGNVVVTVDGVNSNAQTFTYKMAPIITGLSKTIAFAQDTLTVYGRNFNGTGTPIVNFEGVAATVLGHSASEIKVRIPNSVSGNVVVTVDGVSSNSISFTYSQSIVANSLNQTSPVLRSVSGIDGASVTIKGGNFGTTANRIRVTVGGQNATIVSVTNTDVVFLTPSFSSSQDNLQQIKIYLDNFEATYPNGNLTFNYLEPTILSTTATIVPAIGLPAGWYTFTFVVNGNNYNATAPNANFEMLIDGVKYNTTVNGNTATITFTQTSAFVKNRYDIRVNNKWGSFISAFQRNVTISDFDYSTVNGSRTITIDGNGFGSTADLNRSVRVYRIINGVKNYLTVASSLSWTESRLIATFSENFLDDLTYGVEVRVNSRLATKEKFIDYIRVN
ncbi:IPT/TIG domain-containing protein [Pedobacter namyangjuensis]|uniref:IPT/TIG domain-containing protein n=1 Tax=Pedobacter namyangjuensis TaxID=600626 RepID=UPI000DE3504B|nr:IPT/TIG domain-containing protein [Pedobacter namyangjuensis]